MPEFMQNAYASYKNKSQIKNWNKQGNPLPIPHAIKQEAIVKYKNKYKLETMVETGTYLGDMVWAQRHNFSKIYSIELSKELASMAQKRFKKDKQIEIIQGDSGRVMKDIIGKIDKRSLFWLDGHYSAGNTARGDKDCPIMEEVKSILSTGTEHILLIDDARCFVGMRDYPTLEGLSAYILKLYPNAQIHVENDCIIVEPKE